MSTISIPHSDAGATRRRARRLLTLPAAAVAVVLVWLLADKVAGVDLHQPAFGSAAPASLSAGFVATVGLVAALLGWASLAVFERFSGRARQLWLWTSLLVLLVSLAGPLSGQAISNGNRLALVAMHLAAAAVVIPLLYRSSASRVDAPNRASR